MKREPLFIGLTDTHLHRNSLEENISIFRQVIIHCKQLKLKVVYHFGDIFTNRDGQTLATLITFHKILMMFEEAGITLIAIPGNHDKVFLNSDNSYLDIFKGKFFKVIDSPQVGELSSDFELAFLPYYKEVDLYPEQLKKVVSLLNPKKKYVLLTHVAINGVKNNDGSEVENELSQDLFKRFHKVFVGHYHNRGQVGKNIFYTGSAFPQDFSEDGEKGFVVFYSDGYHDYIKPKFKEFIKIPVPLDQLEDFIKEDSYKELIEAGNKVRFVISGEDTTLKAFDKKRVTDLGFSVQLKGKVIEENIQVAENEEFVSFDMQTIGEFYKKFCKENTYSDKLGINYLNKVKA